MQIPTKRNNLSANFELHELILEIGVSLFHRFTELTCTFWQFSNALTCNKKWKLNIMNNLMYNSFGVMVMVEETTDLPQVINKLYHTIITLLSFFIEMLQYDWLWSGHMIIKEMLYIPIKLKPELARASMTTSDVNNQWRSNFKQQII